MLAMTLLCNLGLREVLSSAGLVLPPFEKLFPHQQPTATSDNQQTMRNKLKFE